MTAKYVKNKERKLNVIVMLTEPEIKFLDRKVNKNFKELSSRSAILRLLIHRTMARPGLLDVAITRE